MTKKLIKNTGIYIAMSGFSQGLIFLLWIILAWWLSPSQIGVYALVMVVIEFFSTINIFGLDSAITRFYYTKERNSSILSNALAIFLSTSLLTLILFLLAAQLISSLFPGLSNILEKNLLLFVGIVFANSAANFVLVHYTALKKAIFYAKFQTSKVLFFCFLSLILVHFGFGILGVFYALLYSSVLVAILFIINEKKTISVQVISPQIIKNITSYGFPLMLYSALGVIIMYFGQLLLDRYTDLATLGVYSFFLMLTIRINGLWSSFNRAWTPEIFSKFLDDKKRAIENVKFMAFFSSFVYLTALALFIILGKLFLFKLLFKEIYLSNIYLFYILLLAPLFTGIYTAAYPLYYYEKRTKLILYLSIFMSGFNFFLTFFMVKNFGQTGAASSFFVVLMTYAILYLFAFKNIIHIPSEVIRWTLLLALLMVAGVGVLLITSSSLFFLGFILLGVGLAYQMGDLSEKRYLFSNLIGNIKMKFKI